MMPWASLVSKGATNEPKKYFMIFLVTSNAKTEETQLKITQKTDNSLYQNEADCSKYAVQI